MLQFEYTIKDELGIHARPAGMLVKLATTFRSEISIKKGDASANAKKLIGLMKLGIQKGDTAVFTIEGDDEVQAAEALQNFMQENL